MKYKWNINIFIFLVQHKEVYDYDFQKSLLNQKCSFLISKLLICWCYLFVCSCLMFVCALSSLNNMQSFDWSVSNVLPLLISLKGNCIYHSSVVKGWMLQLLFVFCLEQNQVYLSAIQIQLDTLTDNGAKSCNTEWYTEVKVDWKIYITRIATSLSQCLSP